MILAILDEVRAEHEDRSRKYRQDLQRFKAKNTIPEKVNLVDFEHADEALVDPREDRLERTDTELA